MEFFFLLFVGWILWSIVAAAARKAPPPPPQQPLSAPDWFALAQERPEHVRMVGPAPPAVLPGRATAEESSSELMWDETAGDLELDAYGSVPAEVVRLETTEVPLPAPHVAPVVVSLEQEVDWEVEHERFHKRYVDVRSPGAAARHGLLDEMRDPAALRRAVLLSEILGPPKALRRPQ